MSSVTAPDTETLRRGSSAAFFRIQGVALNAPLPPIEISRVVASRVGTAHRFDVDALTPARVNKTQRSAN